MKRIILFCFAILLYCTSTNAQTTITTQGNLSYPGDIWIGGDVTVTFVVQNNNSHDIVLTGLEDFKSTAGPGFPLNPAKFILWYSATSLSGSPGLVSTPIWTKLTGDSAFTVIMVPGYNTIISNLNFVIPANTTYRFALECTTGLAYSGNGTPTTLTKDSVSLILGGSTGYASSYPNSSYNNSSFTGSITFHSSVPCTSPPVAGTTISATTDTCSGWPFQLAIDGYSSGVGQTYQWQDSTNNGGWNNIAGATQATVVTSQAVSTYYRCAVTCASNTGYSTPLQITTPTSVSGTYTINATLPTSGTNFHTFAEAITYISCGINGPTVFNVVPGSGPYNEQISIPFIGGTSGVNTVTFNGNGETLYFNTATSNNKAIVTLNDADHIIFDSLTIDGSAATTYCWGILFTNKADSNIIRKCNILNDLSSSALAYFNGILFNGSTQATATGGNNGNYNLIQDNTISGGAYGVYLYGAGITSLENVGNKIIHNTIKDFYNAAIYSYYVPDGLVISKNDISRPTRTNSGFGVCGINISQSTFNTLAEKNKIHNLFDAMPSNTNTCYAIRVDANTSVGKETKLINNLVYNMNGSGALYGIYNSSASNMQAYHNTIVLDEQGSANGAAYGLVQSGSASGVSFMNNVVSITRNSTGKQRCLSYANTANITSNHNALYMNCPQSGDTAIGQFANTAFATLANWRTVNNNAFDQQSASTNPLFLNAGTFDFTPSAPAINDIGQDLNIATDILENSRSVTPDPGAYEFTIAGCLNPPNAGTASTTVTSSICPNISFGLELIGNSYGAGQTYQWQSSTNNSNWTNIGTASTNPLFSNTQLGSNYYRCAVQCNGGTIAYSTSVLVNTPSYLSGTYTINNTVSTGGTNFQSFNDAINAARCGMNGPVVFNVVAGSGPYNEHFTIPQIAGSSAINTLTINGNGATLLYSSTDQNNRAGIILNGADHVIIDSLVIDVSGGTYSLGIVLMNQADSNIIRKCTINSNATSTNQNAMGVMFSGSASSPTTSGNNANYNTFTDNIISGGYYSFSLYGNSSSSTQNINNVFRRNILTDMYSYGFNATYQSAGLVISQNDISRPTRTNTTSTGGAYIYTGCASVLVEKNKVHNLFDAIPTSTQGSYGFFIGASPAIGQENKVINNLVYNMNGNGTVYGILCTFGGNCQMYHNTIVLDDQTATTGITYGIHEPMQLTGIDFRNNIVYVSRSGTGAKYCVSFGSSSASIISNNNVLYIPSSATGNIAVMQGTNYATLAAWQASNSNLYDQLSVSADPVFTSISNYKPTATAIDNVGAALNVVDDIVGVVRSIGKPDAGAYEFGTILPITSLNLRGEKVGSINKLVWTTATENNNLGFELLRANTTNNDDFAKVNFVASKAINGNSSNTLIYTYDDANATANTTYYNLKQIDKDGKFYFSNTIVVKAAKAAGIDIVGIYPNPTKENLNVTISSPLHIKASLIIADIFGKIIMQQNINLAAGETATNINVSKLAAGNYTIKLSCENGCESTVKKFVKL